MLKQLPQPRESPASSPRFHYVPTSHSSPASPSSSRRPSKPTTPALGSKTVQTQTQVVKYVDVGTQWSPIMTTKTDAAYPERMRVGTVPAEPPAPKIVPVDAALASLAQLIPAESPSAKRRQSQIRGEGSSTSNNSPALPPKRAKAQGQVKVLPARYEFCEVEDVVILVASMISELIQTNDALPLRSGVLTRFHSRTPPGISVLDYLQRLAKHATLTPPLLLSMVYYIDRLCSLYPAFTITTLTVHRFLITAATVAAKGLSDSFWNNATYARVGGIKIAELGVLELEFLYRVDWKIVPNPEVLVDYYRGLVERAEGYEIETEISSTDEDEEGLDEDSPDSAETNVRAEQTTDREWNAWMQDVSTGRGKEVEQAVKKEEDA